MDNFAKVVNSTRLWKLMVAWIGFALHLVPHEMQSRARVWYRDSKGLGYGISNQW